MIKLGRFNTLQYLGWQDLRSLRLMRSETPNPWATACAKTLRYIPCVNRFHHLTCTNSTRTPTPWMRSWNCNCGLGREAVLLRILVGAEVALGACTSCCYRGGLKRYRHSLDAKCLQNLRHRGGLVMTWTKRMCYGPRLCSYPGGASDALRCHRCLCPQMPQRPLPLPFGSSVPLPLPLPWPCRAISRARLADEGPQPLAVMLASRTTRRSGVLWPRWPT